MATTLPPKKVTKNTLTDAASEAAFEAFINKGGKTVKDIKVDNPEKPKHINIRLTVDIINQISELRKMRPKKPGSPKSGISLHDWVLEAVLEKLVNEQNSI